MPEKMSMQSQPTLLCVVVNGMLQGIDGKRATASNPFFEGPWSDVLAMIPFLLLTVLLYVVGREMWLSGRRDAYSSPPPPPSFK